MPQDSSTLPISSPARRLQQIVQSKLPIAQDDDSFKDLLKVIKACSKEELAALSLAPPALPSLRLSSIDKHQPTSARLSAVQAFLTSFQYNHSTGYHYNVSKKRPLQAILATAAGILQSPLPIKCIEAVFVGILLTQGWTQLQRLPLGFKSRGSDGQVHRHIVLAVCDTSIRMYGALGVSRCNQLMDKALTFTCLAALVEDYLTAYRAVKHELLKVRVGLPVEHDPNWEGPVCWRYCTVNTQRRPWHDAALLLNNHASAAAQLQEQFRHMTCQRPRGCKVQSAPPSPRNGPRVAGRHHSTHSDTALHNTCSTSLPAGANQHPPAHVSPRKQLPCRNQQQSPSGSCNSSSPPKTTAHSRLASTVSSIPSGKDPCLKPCPNQLARPVNVEQLHVSLVSKLHMLPCKDLTSSCEVETSADEGSDSDSEVELVVKQMHRAA